MTTCLYCQSTRFYGAADLRSCAVCGRFLADNPFDKLRGEMSAAEQRIEAAIRSGTYKHGGEGKAE